MKIAEEIDDSEMREQAKVNYGMANASIKWSEHVSDILKGIEGNNAQLDKQEEEEEIEEREGEEDEQLWGIWNPIIAIICLNIAINL